MGPAGAGRRIGILVGAGFGLVYLLVNAGELPAPAQWLVRAVGVAAFLGLLALVRRAGTVPTVPGDEEVGFTRAYWVVVAAEAVAIVVGARLLTGPLDFAAATLPWVTFVVGSHFIALAVIWRAPMLHGVAGFLIACGIGGLAAALADQSSAVVAVIAGLLPGAGLLISCYVATLLAVRREIA